jgi:CBS domain-containing protein
MEGDEREVTVGSLMTRDPVCVGADASLVEVAELLEDYGISGLPVVDRAGRVVGVVSRTDLVRVRAAMDPWPGWHGMVVGDLMTTPAITIHAAEPVSRAAQEMSARQIHRLVVVGDDATPIGVLSEADIVRDIAHSCAD